jgi:hypothetical protein
VTYRRRVLARIQRRKDEAVRQQMEVIFNAEDVMRRFERAYFDLHLHIPKIRYSRGWYKIAGHCYRREQVEQKIKMLHAEYHQRELES